MTGAVVTREARLLTTAAGKRLLDYLDRSEMPVAYIVDDVVDIESEARASVLAEIRAKVIALGRDRGDDEWDTVARSEVLGIIEQAGWE